MAPPWGVGWRKCDPCSTLEVPPKFRRSSVDVSRGVRKPSQKIIDFWMPFWIHLGSIWPPFLVHFGMISRFSFGMCFRCVFCLLWAPFVITPTFDFGALACTPSDFSSFRHVAKSTKKTLKYLQNWSQKLPQNNKNTTNKSIKKCI